MKAIVDKGMRAGEGLVYLDSETGRCGSFDVAVLDRNRIPDQRLVKVGFNGFGHQKVWDRHSKMDVCRPLNGTCIEMWRDLRVVGFGDGCDLFCLPDTAGTA